MYNKHLPTKWPLNPQLYSILYNSIEEREEHNCMDTHVYIVVKNVIKIHREGKKPYEYFYYY